jgi:hypothetical protein
MRRRYSLALLAILVVLAIVVSTRYRSAGNRTGHRVVAAGAPRDSLARGDSAAEADARRSADTLCFASRIFLPCDPR